MRRRSYDIFDEWKMNNKNRKKKRNTHRISRERKRELAAATATETETATATETHIFAHNQSVTANCNPAHKNHKKNKFMYRIEKPHQKYIAYHINNVRTH